jgi:hypothetical protein
MVDEFQDNSQKCYQFSEEILAIALPTPCPVYRLWLLSHNTCDIFRSISWLSSES